VRTRYISYAAGALTLLVATWLTISLDPGAISTPALQTSVMLLRIFLVILIARYLLLLWLGYLHHIEGGGTPEMTDAALPPVTIIVPVFNEEEVILSALQSLLSLDYPAFHILVVDDGSTDRTRELASSLAGHYGRITLSVVSKSNGGKAAALNTGLAAATTPYVLCMDGDSRLSPSTLRHAMPHFADPRVAAVAGNVKVVNRNNIWTRLQALEYIEGLNLARRAQGFLRIVNIIPGPIGVFRRDVLLREGGYDNDTFAEDADLTLKLVTAGWHVVYEERAIAWTESPEVFVDLIRQRYRWTRGILQALRKRTHVLSSPREQFTTWMSVAFMFFEAVLWPAVNILGGLMFTLAALSAGVASGIFYWWVLLTMLDVAAALYTIVTEEEDLTLVPYAVVYRFLFVTMIDVAKLFATIEEAANVRMTWGKLARAGRI
jgi:cellulose synthase/poly-beta-1,6-N-acetylglucosamine synthase-like glycosyltransferase